MNDHQHDPMCPVGTVYDAMGERPQPVVTPIPCPRCGIELPITGDLTLVDWINPQENVEGKALLDLVLECDSCGVKLGAFVPLGAFEEVGD